MSSDVKDTAPLVAPKAAPVKAEPNPFPRKRYYEDGFVFNFPISHYENRTEAKIKQDLLDGGNSEAQTDKDMDLIREALAFHKTTFGAKIEKAETK